MMNSETEEFQVKSKFMYINQDLLIKQNYQPKVLINPNFIKVAQVKPHFNKQFLVNQTIHINPNMLMKKPAMENKVVIPTPSTSVPVAQKVEPVKSSKTLLAPRIKLEQNRTRRSSIYSKYKIIRQLGGGNKKSNVTKIIGVRNQFKVDNRSMEKQKLNRSFKSTLNNAKNAFVKSNIRGNQMGCYVNLNGILYKRSSKLLVKKGAINKSNVKKKEPENSRSEQVKSALVGGLKCKQKDLQLLIKTNINRKLLLSSQVKQRSINTLRNKMRKSNVPCPFYRKFGKCRKYENGTCIRIHNPEQISLCPKFLQGACMEDKCLLSHKVSAEKMPTCKFFLEAQCSKDNCPYLHVKINEKSDVCKDFLEGFCSKAAECDRRHEYLCPEHEKTGLCIKRKCPYPHGDMVRKNKLSKSIFTSKIKFNGLNFIPNHDGLIRNKVKVCGKNLNLRYYDESKESCKKIKNGESVDLDMKKKEYKKRPTIGSLPSFIPFS